MSARLPARGAGGGGGGKGGGGGGTARAPIEAPDSLRSIQYARVLDLVSEGEISGLVAGAQSIDINDTPLQNADGTYNFTGVTVSSVNGTQAQGYLAGFPASESENPVTTEVRAAVSVTRTISNANVNAVRVTLSVPQLTQQDTTTGDLNGSTVIIAIDIQANGGGFVAQALPDGGVISGKTTTRYQRPYRLALSGSAPWDIRVRRVTADSTSAALVNKTYWDSYTEIIDAKLSYPNSALVGVQLDASQFTAIPKRSYDINGLKVQIPSNYDPLTRVYTGVWDGTFTTAWTDNPAWCFYDLLTNTRYGLGKYVIAAQIDKWALYSIAQYCDALVPNGFGGYEPRFTCNLFLQTRAEAFKVIANMASIFRGMTYWAAGAITAVADKPADPVALYAMANIIDGKFSYTGSAKNTRHTVALVTWNDPANKYQQAIEYVEDATGIARYGVVDTSVVAFGCTSRGQAHRLGRWLLYSERLETETVTFRCGLDGVLLYPGAVISTQDAARAGKRFGGRVVSATTSAVTIDNPVTIVGGTTYTLMCMAPDGTLVQSTVTNGAGATSVLNVSPALSQAPQVNAMWVLAASNLAPEQWRVLAATEVDKTTLEIVALKHDANKYAAVELNVILESAPTTSITLRPAGVTNLIATEMLFEISAGVVSDRVILSWSGTTGRYRVSYRGKLSNWVILPEAQSQTINIDGLNADIYTFNVVQINGLGLASQANTLTQEIYGTTASPTDPVNFAVQSYSGQAKFTWQKAPDKDVQVGGRAFIRWSPLSVGATWDHGSLVNPDGYPGDTSIGFGPLMTGTYLIKFRDATGNYSDNAASFVVTEALITGLTTIATVTESTAFAGAKSNTVAVDGGLQLDSVTLIDSMLTLMDDWGSIDSIGGIQATGTYTFASKLDLTTVQPARLFTTLGSLAFDSDDLIDSRTNMIDDWGLFDGAVIEDVEAQLMVRVTNDDPNAAPAWGPWHALGLVGDYNNRGFDFRLDFASGNATHNRAVTSLSVAAKH